MLITQLKAKETIVSLAAGKKVFIINCHGCKEVRFPEKEAVELQKELSAEGNVTGIMTTDYICNPENMQLRLQKHMDKIQGSGSGPGILLWCWCTDHRRISGRQDGMRSLRYIPGTWFPGCNTVRI